MLYLDNSNVLFHGPPILCIYLPKSVPENPLAIVSFRMSDSIQTETPGSSLVFTPQEFESISKYLVGNSVRLYTNIIVQQSASPARIQEKVIALSSLDFFLSLL